MKMKSSAGFASALLILGACSQLKIDMPDGSVSSLGGGGTAVDAPVTNPGGSSPISGGGGGGAPGCGTGTHLCGTSCVGDRELTSCGIACDPCPEIKGGGTATCDGVKCGGMCPGGMKLCRGECIAESSPCSGSCPAGTHDCGGICAENASVNSCGPTSCDPCPTPAGAMATCDGMKCDFSCGGQKRCGDKCGECCKSEDCQGKPGQIGSCDLSTVRCKYSCPAGTKDCSGQCVAEAACCKDSDCTMGPAGQVGKCDTGSGKCTFMCPGNTKPCNGACIASSECCRDGDCPAQTGHVATCGPNHACALSCPQGTRDCNGTCVPSMGACCEDGECRPPAGQIGACDGRSHQCKFSCAPGTLDCGNGKCVATGGCCNDGDCSGRFACVNNQCSSSRCVSGFTLCGNQCIPSGGCCTDSDCSGNHSCESHACSGRCANGFESCGNACIRSGSCCTDNDCPRCKECSNGACRDQAGGQDKKRECGSLGCAGGACRVCQPKSGAMCISQKQFQVCNGDGTGITVTTCKDSCGPTGPAQNVDACCGAQGEPCCFDADCLIGLACDRKLLGAPGDTRKCISAIPFGSTCTPGGKPCAENGNCVDYGAGQAFCCSRGVSSPCAGGAVCDAVGQCP
jgi:hypothetical protein